MGSQKSKADYYREWRKKNPDKVAAIQARYWEKRAKEVGRNGGHLQSGIRQGEAAVDRT